MIENKHPEILLELLPLTINADPRENSPALLFVFEFSLSSLVGWKMKVKETSRVPYNLTLFLMYVLYPEKSHLSQNLKVIGTLRKTTRQSLKTIKSITSIKFIPRQVVSIDFFIY